MPMRDDNRATRRNIMLAALASAGSAAAARRAQAQEKIAQAVVQYQKDAEERADVQHLRQLRAADRVQDRHRYHRPERLVPGLRAEDVARRRGYCAGSGSGFGDSVRR